MLVYASESTQLLCLLVVINFIVRRASITLAAYHTGSHSHNDSRRLSACRLYVCGAPCNGRTSYNCVWFSVCLCVCLLDRGEQLCVFI